MIKVVGIDERTGTKRSNERKIKINQKTFQTNSFEVLKTFESFVKLILYIVIIS